MVSAAMTRRPVATPLPACSLSSGSGCNKPSAGPSSELNYMFKGNSQFKQTSCAVYVMHAQLQIDLDHRHARDHELISFRAFC